RGDLLRLEGSKIFCSGAGFAARALLTARDEADNSVMLVVALNAGERVHPLDAPLQGMRGTVTGAVDFSGCSVATDCVLGTAGDYLREPDFSAGAWRGAAVASGVCTACSIWQPRPCVSKGALMTPIRRRGLEAR